MDDIKGITMREAEMVLVGNKADLSNREVPTDLAQHEAYSRGSHFVELSTAQDEDEVQNLFAMLTRNIMESRGLESLGKTPLLVRKLFRRNPKSKTAQE